MEENDVSGHLDEVDEVNVVENAEVEQRDVRVPFEVLTEQQWSQRKCKQQQKERAEMMRA
jgi:hypothetical protein